jgi:hypothetical protein
LRRKLGAVCHSALYEASLRFEFIRAVGAVYARVNYSRPLFPERVVESENLLFWIVFHDPHFVLKQLLDAVLGDEDVAHRDPQLVCGIGA